MCRLMAYIGPPRLIADVVLWPDRSIIKQSYDARERLQDPSLPNHLGFGNLNGDGFGIGWYGTDDLREGDPTPCMYKSITPAWNNENLARLSCKIISPLVFAHVRAAYPGMPVSEQNCHPFQWGRYLFMHNGVVGGFSRIKRRLLDALSDAAYNSIQSFHSDSAVCFAVFLNHLPDLVQQQPPNVLLNAMQAAITTITSIQDALNVQDVSLLNFVVSDGATMVATRFVRPEAEAAATLYYAEGASFHRLQPPPQQPGQAGAHGSEGGSKAHAAAASCAGCPAAAAGGTAGKEGAAACSTQEMVGSSVLCEASYGISYSERGASVAFVASEPITGSTTDWVCVPKNTVLVVTREKGGFLSVLQSSLSTGAQPDPRLAEVSTCLASIAQGVHTKSRAWVARRQPGGPSGGGAGGGVGTGMGASPGGLDALMSPRAAQPGLADGLLGIARSLPEPETVTMEEEHMLTGHLRAVLALAVDEASSRLYSSSADATVRAWDLSDMSCVAVIRGHSKPVTQLQLLGGRLLFTAAGGGVRVWDTASFVCLAKVKTSFYSGAIRSLLVTPDGTVYVGHQDMTVKKYLPLEAAAAGCSGGGTRSSSGGAGGSVPDSIPASPRLTAAGAQQGAVRPPDAQTSAWDGHVGPVNDLVACGPYICSAGGDTTVRVWRASNLSLVRVLRGHRGSVLCLLAVGHVLLSGSRDNTIRVWDMDLDFVCCRALAGHKDDVVHLDALGLSGGGLAGCSSAGGGGSGSADAAGATGGGDGAAASTPRASRSQVRAASPAPFGATVLVASASADGTVRVWSSSWTCLRILTICAPTHVAGLWEAGSPTYQQQQQQRQGSSSWQMLGAPPAAPSQQPPQQQPQPQQTSSAAAAAALLAQQPCASAAAAACSNALPPVRVNGCSHAAAPAAVVKFAEPADDGDSSGLPGQQQQQCPHEHATRQASFQHWQQDGQQHLQEQQQTPFQPQHDTQQLGSHQRHPQPKQQLARAASAAAQQRASRRLARQHMPATAALVVAISSRHIVGGYSDASIRLWHMDDVYVADLTEQLASGQIHGCDLALLQEQLRPFSQGHTALGSWNPFQALSLSSSMSALALSSSCAARQQPHPGLDAAAAALAAAASPPLSPTGLAGQLGVLASTISTASQLLREGSGTLLGVEVTPATAGDRVPRRGCWCARSRDAAPGSSAAPPRTSSSTAAHTPQPPPAAGASPAAAGAAATPPPAAAAAAAAGVSCADGGATGAGLTPLALPPRIKSPGLHHGGLQQQLGGGSAAGESPAVGGPGTVQCLACGSQDQQLVRALREFVGIRTVSNNKALHDECLRGAKYVARLLDALGAEVRMAQPYDGKNPVVLGRLGHNPEHPTVVFYGHYDVQPAEEPDWRTNPFECTAVDGYLCGRGTSDNKGPMLAFIFAVKEMLDCWRLAGASAPLNFAFLFEGEEENGSLGFQESIASSLDWFADAALVVISNTVWVGEKRPCLTYGMRGMVTASLVVSGPQRDLHSGNDGGVFTEPMADLVQLLGSLHGPGGKILVPGFYNDVRPQLMQLAWQGLEDSEEFSMASYRSAIGVPQLTTPPNKYDLLNARWCSPTLSIVDIRTAASPVTAGQQPLLAAAAAAVPGGAAAAGKGATAAQAGSKHGSSSSSSLHNGSGSCGRLQPGSGAHTPASSLSPVGNAYAHSPAAAGFAGSGSCASASAAAAAAAGAALNMGLQPLPLGGCVHGHHHAEDAALWPPITAACIKHAAGSAAPARGAASAAGRRGAGAGGGAGSHDAGADGGAGGGAGASSSGAGAGSGGVMAARHLGGGAGGAAAADDRSCYRFGPTRFSVIPKVAVGKLSLRFVPQQDHQALIACLQQHVQRRFEQQWSANQVHLQVHSVGDWWEADPQSTLFQMAARAVRREWGVDPLYVREGGTMPVASLIEKMLGAPALMIPMGQSSDNCHLANERIRQVNLIKGKNVVRHLLEEVAVAAAAARAAPAAAAGWQQQQQQQQQEAGVAAGGVAA